MMIFDNDEFIRSNSHLIDNYIQRKGREVREIWHKLSMNKFAQNLWFLFSFWKQKSFIARFICGKSTIISL